MSAAAEGELNSEIRGELDFVSGGSRVAMTSTPREAVMTLRLMQ